VIARHDSLPHRRTPAHPLRVGLIGFGKTGGSLVRLADQRDDIDVTWVVRRTAGAAGPGEADHPPVFSTSNTCARWLFANHPVDAVIDFSSPTGLEFYGDAAAAAGASIVNAVSAVERDAHTRFRRWSSRTRVLWSPNITLGINVMMLLAQTLRAVDPCADIEIVEEHFRGKRETSGTALRLADSLGVAAEAVKSVRAGGIVGTHEVIFGSDHQTVRLRHESISREAFADGALFAARQLQGRPNGLYRMEDLLVPYVDAVRYPGALTA